MKLLLVFRKICRDRMRPSYTEILNISSSGAVDHGRKAMKGLYVRDQFYSLLSRDLVLSRRIIISSYKGFSAIT